MSCCLQILHSYADIFFSLYPSCDRGTIDSDTLSLILVPSGAQLPDNRQGDGPEPGPLPRQRRVWLRPEARVPEGPLVPDEPQLPLQGALAAEEDVPRHGKMEEGPQTLDHRQPTLRFLPPSQEVLGLNHR